MLGGFEPHAILSTRLIKPLVFSPVFVVRGYVHCGDSVDGVHALIQKLDR
jgi:hypothetical protein